MFSVIENSLNLDAVKLDALYLVKLIFGEYFCYFDSNHITVLLQLQLYLDANLVLVRESVKIHQFLVSPKKYQLPEIFFNYFEHKLPYILAYY